MDNPEIHSVKTLKDKALKGLCHLLEKQFLSKIESDPLLPKNQKMKQDLYKVNKTLKEIETRCQRGAHLLMSKVRERL